MASSARRFACTFAAVAGFGLAASALFVATIDPYWLWRQQVDWKMNPALENRMRFAKSLQVVARQPDVVLLGSSVVYRGIDPANVPGRSVYNLGISSLRIREAEVFVRQLVRWVHPREIVLGLDYFAFDSRHPYEAGFNPALPDLKYLVEAAATSLVSNAALADAWRLTSKQVEDSDGRWQRNGYKRTRPRTPGEIESTLQMTRKLFSDTQVDTAELAALARIIEITRTAGITLKLFVPPYHATWLQTVQASVAAGLDFDAWLAEVTALARRSHIELWDFVHPNPYAAGPVGQGSLHYLDPSHFSPLLGHWILIRLRTAPDAPVPDGFGVRLS